MHDALSVPNDDYHLRAIVVTSFITGLLAAGIWRIAQLGEKRFAERFTMVAFLFGTAVSGIRGGTAFFQAGVPDPLTGASALHDHLTGIFRRETVLKEVTEK